MTLGVLVNLERTDEFVYRGEGAHFHREYAMRRFPLNAANLAARQHVDPHASQGSSLAERAPPTVEPILITAPNAPVSQQ